MSESWTRFRSNVLNMTDEALASQLRREESEVNKTFLIMEALARLLTRPVPPTKEK